MYVVKFLPYVGPTLLFSRMLWNSVGKELPIIYQPSYSDRQQEEDGPREGGEQWEASQPRN